MADTATALTWRGLLRAVGAWLRRNLPRALVTSAISFAFGWLVNFAVMAFRWDGFRAPSGESGVITAENSLMVGSLFWMGLSSFLFAIHAYGRRVGWDQVRQEVLGLPQRMRELFQGEERNRSLTTLAWAATLSLLIGSLVSPSVAAISAAFFIAFAATPLGTLLNTLLRRLWIQLIARLAPHKGEPTSDVGGAAVSAAGMVAGFVVALTVDGFLLKAGAIVVAGLAAYYFANEDELAPGGSTAVLVLVAAAVGLHELFEVGVAFADDGGWSEYCAFTPDCNIFDYVRSQGAGEVIGRSTVGGGAAAVGAPVGAAIGDLLGTIDGGSSGPGGDGVGDDGDPTGGGGRTQTLTLTGDAARRALAGQVGDEIDIPEDQQWELDASSGDRRIAEGHIGERGRITGFGGVATGPDGEIVVIVDVETDGPTRPDIDQQGAEAPPTETSDGTGAEAQPARPTAPPPGTEPAGPTDIAAPPPATDAPPRPATPPPGAPPPVADAPPPAPEAPPPVTPTDDVPPAPEAPDTPTEDAPDLGEVAAATAAATGGGLAGVEAAEATDDAARGARPPDDEIIYPDGTTRKERLEQLRRDEERAKEANSWFGWARATVAGTLSGMADEVVNELPGQVYEAGVATIDMAGQAFDAVTDPENLRVVAEGTAETIYDVGRTLLPPGLVDSSDVHDDVLAGIEAARDAVESAGTIAGTLFAAAEDDPAGAARAVVEAVINKDNWDKAMDPDTPVLERMGRAVYGAVDGVATLSGLGAGGLAAIDKAGDMLRGARALDAATDSARTGAVLDDMARASAEGVDAATDTTRIADTAADTRRAADTSGDAGRAADTATTGRARPGEAQVPGGPGRIDGPNRERPGVPDRKIVTDYVSSLPENAIIDANRITDTGYTGAQLNGRGRLVEARDVAGNPIQVHEEMGLADIARRHRVDIETRTTNADSMRHIRDGTAEPKPLDIKSKTIKEVDTYLGAKPKDRGLVGYFHPKPPDPFHPDFNKPGGQKLYKEAVERYSERREDFEGNAAKVRQLQRDGKAVWNQERGVMIDARTGKPYAGDIDPVIFRDVDTGLPVDRVRYEQVLRDYVDPRNAVGGQHGAEHMLVRDVVGDLRPGTPAYDEAVHNAAKLHSKLQKAHKDGEVVVRMGPDGVLRRGRYYGDDLPRSTTPEIDDVLGGR